jgi:methylglutaconyl-CoA hydratase
MLMRCRFSVPSPRRFAVSSLSTTSSAKNVDLEHVSGGVYCLSLCRHEGKNAFSKSMLSDLKNCLTQLHTDSKVSVLVVRSTVDKVFCAGADLKERATMPDAEVGQFVEGLRNTFSLLANLPFPTIAAIEGAALGGGLELALACDLRISGSKALLGLPETSLAIIPGAGGTQRLPRVVGIAKAKEMMFTSARLNGEQAAAIGLVTENVEPGKAFERAIEISKTIDEKGPIAQRAAKEAIDRGMDVSLQEGLKIEKACYDKVIYTADRREGNEFYIMMSHDGKPYDKRSAVSSLILYRIEGFHGKA